MSKHQRMVKLAVTVVIIAVVASLTYTGHFGAEFAGLILVSIGAAYGLLKGSPSDFAGSVEPSSGGPNESDTDESSEE